MAVLRVVMLAMVLSTALAAEASDEPWARSGNAGASSHTLGLRALEVTVLTRSERGTVFCAIWPDARGFPIDQTFAAHDGSSVAMEGHRARIRFEGIAPGEYALACFHDENANRTLDTNFVGIPSEGTGASNDARGFMGPPSYEDARFQVSSEGPERLTIRIEY